MKIASAWSVNPDWKSAVDEIYRKLIGKMDVTPQLILLHSSCEYENDKILHHLRTLFPETPIQGGTSCLGVMTEEGFHTENGKGMGILAVHDPEGSYGAGISEVNGSPASAAKSALNDALSQAKRPGEVPDVILITNYPGHEDQVIRAIEEHIGTDVPIIGGTSADNDMSGKWQQFGNDTVILQGVSVAVLFTSGSIGYAFHGGYEPTDFCGIATKAEDRVLYEIDGRPAAQVYNEWTDGLISDVLPKGGSLVPTANFTPVGNPVGQVGGIPYFRLSYPVEVLHNQALLLFTEVHEGTEIALMRGTHDSLASRAGRVGNAAVDAAPFSADEIAGSMVLFCAGCMLAIQDRMSEPVEGLRSSLHGSPFLGAFTLGEQGCLLGGENRHGNLMIAALTFGPK